MGNGEGKVSGAQQGNTPHPAAAPPPSPPRGEGAERTRGRKRAPDLRLLCERCGYHLKGLKRTDVCPECGKPVVESLPGKRVLEPWHTRAKFFSSVRIALRVFRHPVRYWDTLPLRQDRPEMLIVDGSVLSALVLGVTTLCVAAFVSAFDAETGSTFIGLAIVAPLPLIVVYITLSAIEMMGLRLMAWKHRWREGGYSAKLVVANAVVAWSVASVLVPIGVALGTLAGEVFARVGVVAGFLVGLLAFETLVYIGMQRMKYANPPGSERELGESGVAPLPPPAAGPSPARGEGGG